MELSEEQKKVCHFIKHGIGSAFIEAYAGSGKSTTLLQCVREIPLNKSVLMISHNLDVAKHLREKINTTIEGRSTIKEGWKYTKVNTYHSLGYHIIKENKDKLGIEKMPEPDDRKYVKYINDNYVAMSGVDEKKDPLIAEVLPMYRSNLLFLIDHCRHNLNQSPKDVKKTMEQYGVVQFVNEPDAVIKCLEWGKTHLDSMDFQDFIWLPYELRLHTKQFLSDFVFVDEAQDTSRAQLELFKKCIKRNTRYIAVGDEFQAINTWCGSDVDSFKKFGGISPRVTRFGLTTSFRCGKNIIKLAQKIVPGINSPDDMFDGEVLYNKSTDDIREGDMVLCRNGSPLMGLYLRFLKAGKRAYILGEKQTYNSLLAFIKSLNAQSVGELAFEAQKCLICLWERVAEDFKETLEDAACNEHVVTMYDQVQMVLSLASFCRTMDEVFDVVEKSQFSDESKDSDAIKLSTIHKAKGLEKDRVFILYPSMIPSRLCKKDWEFAAEENLKYVMITRAIHSLIFIDEDEYMDRAFLNPLSMYNKLLSIKSNVSM